MVNDSGIVAGVSAWGGVVSVFGLKNLQGVVSRSAKQTDFAVTTSGFYVLGLILIIGQFNTAQAGWLDWWSTPEQQAAKAYEQARHEDLLSIAPNEEWAGIGHFQSGDYEQAATEFKKSAELAKESGDAEALNRVRYNQGVSKTLAGQYQEALEHFDQVLAEDDAHVDALQNREVAKRLLTLQQQEQEQEQQGQSGENGEGSEGGEQGQGEDQQNQQQDSQEKQSSESTQSDQSGDDQNSGEPKTGEQDAEDQDGQSAQDQGPDEQQDESGRRGEQEDGSSIDENAEPGEISDANAEQAQREAEQARQALEAEAARAEEEQAEAELTEAELSQAADDAAHAGSADDDASELMEIPLSEEQQATEQLLRRIPDDPAGLLRRKLQQSHRSAYPQVRDGIESW